MQIGIMSTSLEFRTLAEAFQQAAEAGASGLEIVCHTDQDAEELTKDDYLAEMLELSSKSGVTVCSICLSNLSKRASLIGTEQQIESGKAVVRSALQAARKASIGLVLVPFCGRNAIEVEQELAKAADSVLDLTEFAEQSGVVLAVASTLNFDQQQFLLDYVAGNEFVKISGDTGNALARKMDFATGIRDLGPTAIGQVHFRDVRLVEGSPPDFQIALGDGDVDFRAAARALQAVSYDGWVVLETPAGDDPITSGRTNLAFAREVLAISD